MRGGRRFGHCADVLAAASKSSDSVCISLCLHTSRYLLCARGCQEDTAKSSSGPCAHSPNSIAHFSPARGRLLNPSSTTRRSPSVTLLENRKASLYLPIKMSTAELASSYAALILADDGIEITVCDAPQTRLNFATSVLTCYTRPTSSRPSSLPPRSRLSPSGLSSSPRYDLITALELLPSKRTRCAEECNRNNEKKNFCLTRRVSTGSRGQGC